MAKGYKSLYTYLDKRIEKAQSDGFKKVDVITKDWQKLGYLCESDYILVNTTGLGLMENCSGIVSSNLYDYQATKGKLYRNNCFGCGAVINKSKYKCDYCGNWY